MPSMLASEDAQDLDLTVVIPTFNGADRIPQVLDKLRSQVTPPSLGWEVIVVDNNSQDSTAQIIQQWQTEWLNAVPLKYVFEPNQGLAYARQCGVDHAQANLIAFLDDDNWPKENWVSEVVNFSQQYPKAGAFGGRIKGVFETVPDASIKPLLRFLAIRDNGNHPYQFQPEKIQLPPGAGLVVRKQAWLNCIPKTLRNVTRGGNDYEISLRMAKGGWEIWYNPGMEIDHFIPNFRLERQYLLKLTHLHGARTCSLLMLQVPPWKQPILLARSFLGSVRRICLHYWQYPHYSGRKLEFDCQLAFHLGNLKSPFIYLLNLRC
jgi:glycosyltransferase involved in cell wall biosynthesis